MGGDAKEMIARLARDVAARGGYPTHVVVNPATLAKHPEIADVLDLELVLDPRCPPEQAHVMDHNPCDGGTT